MCSNALGTLGWHCESVEIRGVTWKTMPRLIIPLLEVYKKEQGGLLFL